MKRSHPIVPTLLSFALLAPLAGCSLFGAKPAWEEPPPKPATGPIVEAADLHRHALPNGIEIIVLEDHRLPRVALGVTLREGLGSVAPAKAGIEELAAEVMQRGAGDRDALALAKIIEDAGASLDVGVAWDSTTVALDGLSKDRALFESILADVTKRPRFEAAEFEKARGEQLAGLAAAVDEPMTLVRWHFLETLYAGHRYGLPESGSVETVRSLTLADARAYWEDRFVPRNAIFWAVGDVEAESFFREIEAGYGALPDRAPSADAPAPPMPTPAARRIVIVDEPDLVQAHILIGHEGIARTEPLRIPIDLMNDALGGGGFSSRLMKVVRGKNGLTYGVSSGFGLRRQPGPFQISTFTKVETVGQVVDLVLAEMEAIRGERPVEAEELAKFVSYSVGSFGLGLETSRAVLSSLVDLEVEGLPDDSLDTFRGRVAAAKLEEVQAAAKTRLHPERAAIVVLGSAAKITPQLEHLGKIEVVKP